MDEYIEKLLIILVDRYRKSKKDSGENLIIRRTKMKPTELYKKYYDNNGDIEVISIINEAVEWCKERNFVTYKPNGFGYELEAVYLVDNQVEVVEEYLFSTYGYESKNYKRQYVKALIAKYNNQSLMADKECENLQKQLKQNKIPVDYLQKEDILKALIFIENNKSDMYIREASMFIYGNSKYFEENTLDSTCRLIRLYTNRVCGEDEMLDEILKDFHLLKEKQKIYLKGDCTIYFDKGTIEVGVFKDGVEFSTEELSRIQKIVIHGEQFVTIENKTSFYRYPINNTVVFYLGGYANRFQRDFLKKVYQDNKLIKYLHFGDIDAGGFFIHENLCQITDIPFQMQYMSEEQLKDERYQSCLQKLTENDNRRLESLKTNENYKAVVSYMLQNQVKLEQEIVGYYERQ